MKRGRSYLITLSAQSIVCRSQSQAIVPSIMGFLSRLLLLATLATIVCPPCVLAQLPPASGVLAAMTRVTAAFRASHTEPGDCHWERATYFFGSSAAMASTGEADVAFARSWAAANNCSCRGSVAPNDFGGGWGYAALNDLKALPCSLEALGATMSSALRVLPRYAWWWVDTLSMNVPQWAYYAAKLSRPDFLAAATAQYFDTKLGTGAPAQPGLWSAAHGLWFRDHTFVASSPPVFWARGQAWAAATIIRTLSEGALPPTHPLAADLWDMLGAMAAAVLPLQGADGAWRSNLLNARDFPEPETSGTAGLVALLAFGVRTGALEAGAHLPAIARGWAALEDALLPDGATVGGCQPEAAAPGPSARNSTSDFCTGLWLLAADEVLALARAPPLPPFDLRPFEEQLLPRWVAQFALASPRGGFAFSAGDAVPHAYGSAGVVHALSVLQQLPADAPTRAAMAAVANSFEDNATGFFHLVGPEEDTGFQPWHSGGWVDSALRILGAAAASPPAFARALAAAGPSAWNATYSPLLDGSAGVDVWASSHKVAALPVQLMLSDAAWAVTFAPFFAWLWALLRDASSPETGFWGTGPLNPPPPSNVRLGGAFHIAFTLECGGQPLPHAAEMLNATLALQDPRTGLWSVGGPVPTYMDQDGVYVALRASQQLGRARWVEVRRACTAFVRAAAAQLLDASAVLGPRSPFGATAHTLAGLVTPVALCAEEFPYLVTTAREWRNTVDVGCFG